MNSVAGVCNWGISWPSGRHVGVIFLAQTDVCSHSSFTIFLIVWHPCSLARSQAATGLHSSSGDNSTGRWCWLKPGLSESMGQECNKPDASSPAKWICFSWHLGNKYNVKLKKEVKVPRGYTNINNVVMEMLVCHKGSTWHCKETDPELQWPDASQINLHFCFFAYHLY